VRVLQTLEVFGSNLDDYLHLVLPPIVKLIEAQYGYGAPWNVEGAEHARRCCFAATCLCILLQ
jgi:hypothetical protein